MNKVSPLPLTPTHPIDNLESVYPSSDGEPLAETQVHVWVILTTLAILTQYLKGQQAVVFANQFFYYIQGNLKARVAPDVIVFFDIPTGMRNNYKMWEEGQTPSIIFEITSASTYEQDWNFKKTLYEQIGIQEYWLFDPLGDWISGQLRGYTLDAQGVYEPTTNQVSQVLKLRLQIEGYSLDFYRLDNHDKLLNMDELSTQVGELRTALSQEQEELEQAQQRAERLANQLRLLGVNPDEFA